MGMFKKENDLSRLDTLIGNGTILEGTLTSREREEDMKKAIKQAIEKMERQLLKYKNKLHDFDHQKGIPEPMAETTEEEYPFENEET